MPREYAFPVKNPFEAAEVTEPNFFIQSRRDWFDALHVDFSPVRGSKQFDQLKFRLGMMGHELRHPPGQYTKLIFSGHRGSGKSVELKRFADEVRRPEAYFVLLADLEQELLIEQMEPEDVFVTLIAVLLRELKEAKVRFDKSAFEDIAREWLSDSEIKKSVSTDFGMKVEGETSAGWSFWEWLSAKGRLSGYFHRNNQTTKTIRQRIKTNPKPLLNKLNSALTEVRKALRKAKKGQDLLFLMDGLEKANPAVYETLFIKDVQLVMGIEAHLVATVPISTFYEIMHQPAHDNFVPFYLPTLRVDDSSRPLFRELVARRADAELFAEGVLDYFIEMSGGSPRILLKLVNQSIVSALGQQVTLEVAQEVTQTGGNERWRTLSAKHKERLRNGDFNDADLETRELLQSLNVLEYNGTMPERRINPLIARFFVEKQHP
jgi:hypothetical protein